MKLGRSQQGCLGILIEYEYWNDQRGMSYGSMLSTIRIMESLCRKGLAEKVLNKYYATSFGKQVYDNNVKKYGEWR